MATKAEVRNYINSNLRVEENDDIDLKKFLLISKGVVHK